VVVRGAVPPGCRVALPNDCIDVTGETAGITYCRCTVGGCKVGTVIIGEGLEGIAVVDRRPEDVGVSSCAKFGPREPSRLGLTGCGCTLVSVSGIRLKLLYARSCSRSACD